MTVILNSIKHQVLGYYTYMKKIGVIINTNAKQVRTCKISIEKFKDIGPDLVDLRLTSTFEELDDVLQDFISLRYPYVGIAGGDGTIHHTITRMISAYDPKDFPAILLLKGGTMDNVARSVKLRGKGTSILTRMVKALCKGHEPEISMRDTMRIGNQYCSLFGFGFVIKFLQEAYGGTEKGVKQNLLALSKAIQHGIKEPKVDSLYQGLDAEVWVDGINVGFSNITGLLASTVEGIGLGFTPFIRAGSMPNTFQVICTGLGGFQLLCHILHIRNGWKIKNPLAYDVIASAIKVKSKKSFTYTMDGDFYESAGDLEVSAGPRIPYVHV